MKYKINYKANDEKGHIMGSEYFLYDARRDEWEDRYNALKQTVTEFVKRHYHFLDNSYYNPILSDQGHPAFMVEYEYDGFKQMFWVSWSSRDPNKITAYKTMVINNFTPFYPEELKLLDSLDIELYDRFATLTGQDITDWFGKRI